MAKFSGKIGYATSTEIRPGVWVDVITEKKHVGDVKRNTRQLKDGESVNNDISVSNSIEIVSAYAREHFFAIRYISWAGALWNVTDVELLQGPRLLLRLGGVYNGPKPRTP